MLIANHLSLQFVSVTQPFLYIPIKTLTGTATSIPLDPGSLWLFAQSLASLSPANSFVGLTIQSGIITFSTSIPVSANPIIIPATVAVTVTLKLLPATPTTPGLPDASVTTPSNVTFMFTSASATLTAATNATLTAFGTTINLTSSPPITAIYDTLAGRLAFPYKTNTSTFSITKSDMKIAVFSGKATITSSAWVLPVSINATPDSLGVTTGAGGMELVLSSGLQVKLTGRDAPLDVGTCVLLVDPNELIVITKSVQSPINLAQVVSLWTDSTASFRLPQHGGGKFEFICQSNGVQTWALFGTLLTTLDAPRAVDGSRLRFTSPGAISLQSNASGVLNFTAEIVSNATPVARSYALKNLLLQLTGPNLFIAHGTYDINAGQITTGSAQIRYTYNSATPFLPDPYATTTPIRIPRDVADTTASTLTMTLSWKPNTPVIIDVGQPVSSNAAGPWNFLQPPQKPPDLPDGPNLPGITLLDLSSNVAQFGVALAENAKQYSSISDLFLQAPASELYVVALPAVQWEPVNTPVQLPPPSAVVPSPLLYADCGPVTQLSTHSVTLTPVAPRQALDEVVSAYNTIPASPVVAKFTLPFGLIANAVLTPSNIITFPSPVLVQVQPSFSALSLTGTDQVSIRARSPRIIRPGVPQPSPSLPGWMKQLDVAFDSTGKATTPITALYPIDPNPTFSSGHTTACVPVTRVDLSGYGESLFSDWRNPSGEPATISKVLLDVIVGRTSREVVQLFSIIYPYAIRVVRTITIERQNGASITRKDSGWQPVSAGTYSFPHPDLHTHPGVVGGVTNVSNIRDLGQNYTMKDGTGTVLMGVRFNCSVQMENVVFGQGPDKLVPALDQVGYIQLAPPGQLTAQQYAELISAVGPLGGPINCTINIGKSGMNARIIRVGVGATSDNPPEFAMAAWGSPILPSGGQWSWVRLMTGTTAPRPVDPGNGVPLVRKGAVGTPVPATNPYCFSDPADVNMPKSPSIYYGILHSTGTQRLLFFQPQIGTSTPFAITSTLTPLLADPFSLGTATGPFPDLLLAIPFNDANYHLFIRDGGNLTLQLPLPSFTTPILARVLRQSKAMRTIAYTADDNGNPSIVSIAIDTTAVAPAKTWSVNITNLSLATETGSLGEVTRIVGSLVADSNTPTAFNQSRLVFGKPLKPFAELVSFLDNFGPLKPLTVSMTNDWTLLAGLKLSLKEILELIPSLKEVVDDLDLKMQAMTSPTKTSFDLSIELTIKVPTSFGPVAIGLAEVEFNLSEDGVVWQFTLGVGIGVDFVVGPFEASAYYAQTQSLITGDSVFGVGAGSIVKGEIDLVIVKVEISLEAKIEMLKSTLNCGPGESSIWGVAQIKFAIEVTIFLIIDIEFDAQAEWTNNFDNGPCALPDT